VILVDGYRRHDWLLQAVDRRLRGELAKLDLRLNEAKSRIVDLARGEAVCRLPGAVPESRRKHARSIGLITRGANTSRKARCRKSARRV
jgi:hypothetical protein